MYIQVIKLHSMHHAEARCKLSAWHSLTSTFLDLYCNYAKT
jgi:hypothetical protein